MYALNYISTIVEDPSNVLSVNCACEVRIAMMCTVLFRISSTGLLADLEEIVPEKKIIINCLNYFKCPIHNGTFIIPLSDQV